MDTLDIYIAVGPYNKLGGIERYNVELVKALVDAGHRVSIIATEVGYPTENLESVYILRPVRIFPSLRFLTDAIRVGRLYFKFKKEHPKGLFISNGLPSLFSDICIAQSVHRQAVIFTNAREPESFKGHVWRVLRIVRPLNLAIITVEWFVVKWGAKRVVAIAFKVQRELIALYNVPEKRIAVVHSGVNASEFVRNAAIRSRIRAENGFSADDFLFLFSGNEFKRKGLAYAIEALEKIHNPKVKLVVAGKARDGAFRKMAEDQSVGERVVFIGPRSDFADWCATCDAFLFPTLDEAFGLVIVESLAAGLPVITSSAKYAGAAECMKNGFDSLLLDDPTDVSEIVSAMHRMMDEEKLRHDLGIHGRQTAEALSWEHVADGIIKAWETGRKDGA